MKTSVKFSLIGGAIGFLLPVGIICAILFSDEPPINTQVLDHLDACGYPIDTLEDDVYAFDCNGEKMIFNYYPDDEGYLNFCEFIIFPDYTEAELQDIANEVMQHRKNTTIIVKTYSEDPNVQIEVNSFIFDETYYLNTDVIDRSIDNIVETHMFFVKMLYETYGYR